eukprot:11461184-Alexandrium_andersonii.AAC.1
MPIPMSRPQPGSLSELVRQGVRCVRGWGLGASMRSVHRWSLFLLNLTILMSGAASGFLESKSERHPCDHPPMHIGLSDMCLANVARLSWPCRGLGQCEVEGLMKSGRLRA